MRKEGLSRPRKLIEVMETATLQGLLSRRQMCFPANGNLSLILWPHQTTALQGCPRSLAREGSLNGLLAFFCRFLRYS